MKLVLTLVLLMGLAGNQKNNRTTIQEIPHGVYAEGKLKS